jgi:hypothetical protein
MFLRFGDIKILVTTVTNQNLRKMILRILLPNINQINVGSLEIIMHSIKTSFF